MKNDFSQGKVWHNIVAQTILLPKFGFGVNGVFMAEPISNLVGGLACFLTMYFTLYRKLNGDE